VGNYRPLPPYLTIKESNIDGLGLFTTKDLGEGENLGISHIYHRKFEGGIRTPLGGFINHSENSNVVLKMLRDGFTHMITKKEIKAGEELTCTYTLYDPTKG
jgi:SET domain-containing protein